MKILTNLIKNKKSKKHTIGITLSGGGVRGFAHLGALKALNENNIYPDIISGVSAGALAGLFYADGYTPQESFDIFYDNRLFTFAELSFPKTGILSIDKVAKILEEHIRAKTFEDLKIPLYIAASDLNDGKIEYFYEGEIIDKVIASVSIPVLFNPVVINKKTYVDGGVFDNLPIEPIQSKCKKLIASHVNPTGNVEKLNSILRIAERSFHLAIGSKITEKSKQCDLFIEPLELKKYGVLSLSKGPEIFKIGYETTMQLLKKNNPF